jgi:transcriptional regulator with XRE-family HTH domain
MLYNVSMSSAPKSPRWHTEAEWKALADAMIAKSQSPESLASSIGTTPRTVRAYLRAEFAPPFERLSRIIQVLGVSESVLRENGPIPPLSA